MTLYYNLCNITPHRAHVTYDGVYIHARATHTYTHGLHTVDKLHIYRDISIVGTPKHVCVYNAINVPACCVYVCICEYV